MCLYIFLYSLILASSCLSNIVIVFVASEISHKKILEDMLLNILVKLLSTLAGSLISYVLNDLIGRKKTLLLMNLFFLIGTILITYTQKLYFQLIGAAFSLVAIGISTVTNPIYIYETIPHVALSFFFASYKYAIPFGEFLLNLILIRFKVVYAVWICLLIQSFMMLLLPETMHYLLKKGKLGQIRNSYQWFYPLAEVEQRLQHLLHDLTQLVHVKRTVAKIVLIHVISHMTGYAYILHQKQKTVGSAGLSRAIEYSITLVEYGLGFIVGCFVDRFRKKLILQISLGIVSATLFGLYQCFRDEVNREKSILWQLVLILIYGTWYPPTLGLIPWLVAPKVFPLQVRSLGCAMGSFANHTSKLIVTLTLPQIKKLEPKYPFLTYACLSLISLLSLTFCIAKRIASPRIPTNLYAVHPDRNY